MTKKTKKILHNIQNYATAAIILTAIITTIIAIFPLYLKLEAIEKRNVIFSRDTSVFIVDQYLLRLKDVAKQISSRTKAIQLTGAHKKGTIKKQNLLNYLNKILLGALRNNANLIGITRLDLKGNIIGSVGKTAPNDILKLAQKVKAQTATSPITEENHHYISIITPVHLPETKEHIGTDIALFNISDLHASISHHRENELGETLIGYKKDGKVHILFQNHTQWGRFIQSGTLIYKGLYNAIHRKQSNLITSNINNDPTIIAYAPTNQTPFGIAVIVKKTELTAALKRTLWIILTVITIVIIFFIAGLELILKPISSKILIEHEELESRIKKGQSALQKANKKLQYLVDHDPLTHLLSHRGFNTVIENELSRAKRHNQSFLLFYIDINNFKKINDKMGHHVGDIVLKTVAERIKLTMRQEDSAARLGGDEFSIIATATEPESKTLLEEKIKNAIKNPIHIDHQIIRCEAGIGTAIFPTNGSDSQTLMKYADQAMYTNKMQTKNQGKS